MQAGDVSGSTEEAAGVPGARERTAGTNGLEQESAEAGMAWAPPDERPRLSCAKPPPGSYPLVGEQLFLEGWAFSRSGGEVSVEVDVGQRLQAHRGLYRRDLVEAFGEPNAAESGWILKVSTGGWEPGVHKATIIARDESGNETTLTRRVRLDPKTLHAKWLADRHSNLPGPEAARRLVDGRDSAPRFLVCVLAIDADRDGLHQTIRSLESQHYPRRSLLVAGLEGGAGKGATSKGSLGDGAVSASVEDLAGGLRRFLDGEADYILFARAGDVVSPHALLALAERAMEGEAPELIYADEDELDADGDRTAPFFKPGWSPELLLGMDYVGPFVSVAREAARKAISIDPAPIKSVYELLLRLVDQEVSVARVPDILYSRPDGVRGSHDERRLAELVEAVARRRGKQAQVIPLDYAGARVVDWSVEGTPKVSIVIATAFTQGLIFRCVESIRERTTYLNYELVLVANPAAAPPEVDFHGVEYRIVHYDEPFNYSTVNNSGARAASGDYLLFLNDDTEVESPDWIERLLQQVQQPGVGIAGGKLIFPDGTLQLGGVVLVDDEHVAKITGVGLPTDDPGYRGMYTVVRNQTSAPGACMMIGRELFDSLEGFEEALAVELGDVDLCLRALERGSRIVWTPFAVLRHHERASRGMTSHRRDHSRFRQRWQRLLEAGDDYYNPNFSTEIWREYEVRDLAPQPAPAIVAKPSGEEQPPSAERFVPETMGGLIKAEHEARYRWAASAMGEWDVLDAGCGVGYGTQILAEAGATRVVGLDLSPEAVEDAVFRAGSIAEFVVGDLQDLPFPPHSFDAVVCFEAIEHVERGDLVLDGFRRILRPRGVLLLSSPNRNVYMPGNPYRDHEYTPNELEADLAKRFAHVVLYRQHPWVTSLISDDAGFGEKSPAVEIGASVRKVAAVAAGHEVYTLAAASDGPLPDLAAGTAVLTDAVDLRAWRDRVNALEAQLRATRGRIAGLQEKVAAVQSSASWRVTSPLRSAKRQVARLVTRARG